LEGKFLATANTKTANTKREINDNTIVEVWNNSIGDARYTVQNGTINIRRTWRLPGTMQEVEFKELKTAFNEPGVRQLFEVFNKELKRYEDGELLIKNELVREKLDLKPLGKYTLDQEQIIDLLKNQSVGKFEETLENCPDSTLDRIIQEAINLPLSDINKINLVKLYSGKDVLTFIQIKNENKNEEEKSRKPIDNDSEENNTGTRRKKGV
jgi:hypothetical protein